MRIRSDSALRRLLEKILELGVSEHAGNLVQDTLRHVGDRSPYRGGKTLTDLLRLAITAARADEDADTAERLEDALSYAMNVMLAPDLQAKYRLVGARNGRFDEHLSAVFSNAAVLFAERARAFAADRPGVSADDLLAYLDGLRDLQLWEDPAMPATYDALRGGREYLAWAAEVFRERLRIPAAGDLPIAEGSVEELADTVVLRARRRALDDLRAVVLNRHSSERDLQRAVEGSLWIFGGRFLSRLGPRRISGGIELDLTLLRPDGTVHVIELKRACVAVLTHQRNRFVPTNEVHRGVAQVMNYLVTLDEDRTRLAGQGIDVRRASATVIIGHPEFEPSAREVDVDEALRVYNSHLSRVEVVTYKQLLDRAARSLDLS